MLRSEIEDNPNIVPSRFVLAIKRKDTGEEVYKARFVLGGHKDRDKRSVVHSATTLKQSSIMLLLELATILGFKLWSTDINQAYLQSAANLKRKIFVCPDVLELDRDTLLQVVKPLYGLTDAGDYWGQTLTDHHTKELKMEQATGDFSLFFKRIAGKLTGISGTYVDDILRTGTKQFEEEATRTTGTSFDSKNPETPPLSFTGLRITENEDGRRLSQSAYISKLQLLPAAADFEMFRSTRAKLAWVVNSRPDIACAVAFASQVTSKTFEKHSQKTLNKIIKYLRSTKDLCLHFPKIHEGSLQLVVYSDASFNNNVDNTSQLGYIVLLMDRSGTCCVLQFSSHKSRRITRSSMAGETIALAEGFDHAFIIKHDLQRILGRKVPLLLVTDSKLLFDVITRNRYTS